MLQKIYTRLVMLRSDVEGATAVEYAILVGIIGATLAVGAGAFGNGLSNVFTNLLSKTGLS